MRVDTLSASFLFSDYDKRCSRERNIRQGMEEVMIRESESGGRRYHHISETWPMDRRTNSYPYILQQQFERYMILNLTGILFVSDAKRN